MAMCGIPACILFFAITNGILKTWSYPISIDTADFYPDFRIDLFFSSTMESTIKKEQADWKNKNHLPTVFLLTTGKIYFR